MNNNSSKYKKTLICISAPANKGKTDTVAGIANILLGYPAVKVIQKKLNLKNMPENIIVQIKNQVIGIDIEGDPNTNFPARINKLAAYPCDAIVCTARTSGDTLEAAKLAAAKNNMLFILTTTYQPDDQAIESIMNGYKAEHIIDLLKKRGHL
jgi:uncharacterized protein with ATP-grasp and redox domains